MKEFLSSPAFLEWAFGLAIVVVVITLLWRNTVWEARGITPVADVERLRTRITGLFPKSLFARGILVGIIILIALGLWGLSSTLTTPSTPSGSGTWSMFFQSPSLKTVWEGTKNYGLWILIVSGVAWGFLSFVQKKKENEALAKSLKSMLVLVLLTLFVVFPSIVTVKGSYEDYNTRACDRFGTKAGNCFITEEGVIVTSAEAFPDGKYMLCSIKPEKAQIQVEWLDSNAVKIRSLKGEFRITHKLVELEKTLINGCPTSL